MDAFKLLTRSITLKHPGLSRSALPSEGEKRYDPNRVNVQTNSRKRRRGSSEPPLSITNSSTPATSKSTSRGTDSELGQRPAGESPTALLAEKECRRILKSHKIKVVNLTETASVPVEAHKHFGQIFPPPLTHFDQLHTVYHLPLALTRNISDQGYTTPTEVQLATVPLLLEKSATTEPHSTSIASQPDLLTIAPTGSGKTLAYLAPLINKIYRRRHQSANERSVRQIRAIVVAPTKELVAQIVNECRKVARGTGVRVTAMRKGMKIASNHEEESFVDDNDFEDAASAPDDDIARVVVKSDIIVTTPLVFVHSISNTNGGRQAIVPTIESLVLDEADVLLDPLFRDQTLTLWNSCTNPDLRISLWSATIGSNIEELTKSTIHRRQVALDLPQETPLYRCIVGLKDSALPTITHKLVYAATEPGKLLGLRQLLHPSSSLDGRRTTAPLRPPFLVFTQTIERAVALHAELLYDIPIEAGGSERIAVLHSDLSDSKRMAVMARFRKGQVWVLITTDLLSRGVDFRGVNGVVNYDIPTTSAAYVHRVGRTGRAGREGGVAVTFYTKDDIKYVKAIANVIAASERAGGNKDGDDSKEGLQKWLLHALPDISKNDKKQLKRRGVEVRRGVKESDEAKDLKAKRKARISTKSGYEKKMENRRMGAIHGSQRRRGKENQSGSDEEWSGIED